VRTTGGSNVSPYSLAVVPSTAVRRRPFVLQEQQNNSTKHNDGIAAGLLVPSGAMNASRCFHPLSAFSLTASVIEDCHDQVRKMSLADLRAKGLSCFFKKAGPLR
jgi:hypothetical protein